MGLPPDKKYTDQDIVFKLGGEVIAKATQLASSSSGTLRRFYVKVEIVEYLDDGSTATAMEQMEVTVQGVTEPSGAQIEEPITEAAKDAVYKALRQRVQVCRRRNHD